MSLKTRIGLALSAMTLLGSALVTTVTQSEGEVLYAYRDSAGVPTLCSGTTLGVKMGQTATKAQCTAMTVKDIAAHADALNGLPDTLPDVVIVGVVHSAYNIGVPGFKSSTAYKCLLKSDYKCASEAILKFKYITIKNKKYDCSTPGNKVCYGLWTRRLWESKALGNQFKDVNEAIANLPR